MMNIFDRAQRGVARCQFFGALAAAGIFLSVCPAWADGQEAQSADPQQAPANISGGDVKGFFESIGNATKSVISTIQDGTKSLSGETQPAGQTGAVASPASQSAPSGPATPRVGASAIPQDPAAVKLLRIPYDRSVPKIKVVVAPVTIGVGEVPAVVGNSIGAQLATALTRIENLVVIDREASSAIAAELQLSQSNLVGRGNKISGVDMHVAQYLIRAVVTEFNQYAKGSEEGADMELGVIGNLLSIAGNDKLGTAISLSNPTIGSKSKWLSGMVMMDVKIVDARVGAIVEVVESGAAFTSLVQGSKFGVLGISKTDKQFTNTVLGQATRAAVNDAAEKIYEALKRRAAHAAR